VSLGGGIDVDAFTNGGPEELPVGVTINGIRTTSRRCSTSSRNGGTRGRALPRGDRGRRTRVLALNDDYRGDLESGGSLGDTGIYQEVVEGDDAQSVLFVNFNADDDWLTRLVESDPKASENLDPLAALGYSQWVDDETMHGLVRLTTD
jgi:hypothetical protein